MCRPRRSTDAPTTCVLSGAGLAQAARRAGDVAAAGVGDQHDVRITAGEAAHVVGDLRAERLDAATLNGRVERSVEVPRLVEEQQEQVEELRTDRALHDLGAELLAGTRLLDDLGLADAAGVAGLLDDDAREACAGRLGGDGGSVVAARRRDHALVAALARLVDREARPAVLEAPRRVGGLVLDEDACAEAARGDRAGERRQVRSLAHRSRADAPGELNPRRLVHVVADRAHQRLVVPAKRPRRNSVIVDTDGATHDLVAAREQRLVLAGRHVESPPEETLEAPDRRRADQRRRRRPEAVVVAGIDLDQHALDDPAGRRLQPATLADRRIVDEPAVDPGLERHSRPCPQGCPAPARTARARSGESSPTAHAARSPARRSSTRFYHS